MPSSSQSLLSLPWAFQCPPLWTPDPWIHSLTQYLWRSIMYTIVLIRLHLIDSTCNSIITQAIKSHMLLIWQEATHKLLCHTLGLQLHNCPWIPIDWATNSITFSTTIL